MDATFEEMLALRKARNIKVATLKDSRPRHCDVFKATRALRNDGCRAARVELRYESVPELFHLRKGVGLTALVDDGKNGPLCDRASGPPVDQCLPAEGRSRKAVDLPDLPGEGDDVRGGPDELERGRQVQIVVMTVKVPSPLTSTSEPLFGCAGEPGGAAGPRALRERVEPATAAKFHVNEEAGARGHLRGRGRLRPERHNLAVLGRWGTGPASAMYIVLPDTASPVGTMSSNAINTVTSPSRVTRNTRLRCPSVTRNPPR